MSDGRLDEVEVWVGRYVLTASVPVLLVARVGLLQVDHTQDAAWALYHAVVIAPVAVWSWWSRGKPS